MLDPHTLVVAAIAFLFAGFVKGVIGLGMPTVSLAFMTLFMGLPAAVQIMVVPTFVTNVWQGLAGNAFRRLARRFRWLLVTSVVGSWLGYWLLFLASPKTMTGVLGALLVLYAGSGLLGVLLMPRVRREALASPVVGLLTGLLAGATGNMSMPAVAYFQERGLTRDEFVQMLGILFSIGALALGGSIAGFGHYDRGLLLTGILAVVPGVVGMIVGQRLRGRLSEVAFRRALFVGLLAVGGHLVWKAFS